eukprot:1637992-Rhodomonas_salina.2
MGPGLSCTCRAWYRGASTVLASVVRLLSRSKSKAGLLVPFRVSSELKVRSCRRHLSVDYGVLSDCSLRKLKHASSDFPCSRHAFSPCSVSDDTDFGESDATVTVRSEAVCM